MFAKITGSADSCKERKRGEDVNVNFSVTIDN
jgi:hypothetical protein